MPENFYCQSDTNPRPSLTGTFGGQFFDVGNTGALVMDDSTGQINLSASRPQIYEIGYTAGTGCAQVNTDLVEVRDNPKPFLFWGDENDSTDTQVCFGTQLDFFAIWMGMGVIFIPI